MNLALLDASDHYTNTTVFNRSPFCKLLSLWPVVFSMCAPNSVVQNWKIAVPRIPHCHSFVFAASVFAQIKRRHFFAHNTKMLPINSFISKCRIYRIRHNSYMIAINAGMRIKLNWSMRSEKRDNLLGSYFWHCRNWKKKRQIWVSSRNIFGSFNFSW